MTARSSSDHAAMISCEVAKIDSADSCPTENRGDAGLELSVIMPCLNEAETLGNCIRKAQAFLLRSGVRGEIVIGDNGSVDGSQQIATELCARVIPVPVRGYGAAVYGAVMASRGRYCIMADSDESYDFERLEVFLERLREGSDLVMGNRFRGGITPGAMPWKNRYIGNPMLSTIGRVLFGVPVRDFHCGIRGFSKAAFNRLDLRTTGMEFASEMPIKAKLMGMKITEVPTTLSPDGRSRPPHLRPYRDGWRHLRFMLLFCPNWLFLYPGMAMMFVGLFVGGLILARPIRLNRIQFGLDTLIYCSTMLVTGFQSALFWILSRVYALHEGLYPKNGDDRHLGSITLERGLAVGSGVLLCGLSSAIYALWEWKQHAFGNLDTERIARIVIPSSIAISLGFEIVLFSFLLSTFGLRLRPMAKMAAKIRSLSSAVDAVHHHETDKF
jgi:glycosyltransferase involved in cell wall biosynthesis